MRAVPGNLNLDTLIGQSLDQICIGAHDLQFRFTTSIIGCEGSVWVSDSLEKHLIFGRDGWEDTSSLMRLAGKKVRGWKKESSHLLSIHLENGFKIDLESEDSPWENFVLNTGEFVW